MIDGFTKDATESPFRLLHITFIIHTFISYARVYNKIYYDLFYFSCCLYIYLFNSITREHCRAHPNILYNLTSIDLTNRMNLKLS